MLTEENELLELGIEVEEFLAAKRSVSFKVFRSALNNFMRYYRGRHGEEATLSGFLDALDTNAAKPRRERTRLAEAELNTFIDYLKNKELSNNSIRTYVMVIKNFLKYKGFTVTNNFIKIPPEKSMKENRKHPWKIDDVRAFVNNANSMRDKALILCMFQSGISVGEICRLDYGNIKKEFEAGVLPLILELTRGKTGVEFKTFFGRDAVKYLRLYLETRKNLKHKTPLFTQMNSDTKRLTKWAIQSKFREYSTQITFARHNEANNYNPIRPHSLRSGFNSRLTGKADRTLIEFFMGHSIGTEKLAYLNLPNDELRELYANIEHLLAIEKTSKDEIIEVRERGFPAELTDKIEGLETELKRHRDLLAIREEEARILRARLSLHEEQQKELNKAVDELSTAITEVEEHLGIPKEEAG